jgi:hypothetical protein
MNGDAAHNEIWAAHSPITRPYVPLWAGVDLDFRECQEVHSLPLSGTAFMRYVVQCRGLSTSSVGGREHWKVSIRHCFASLSPSRFFRLI